MISLRKGGATGDVLTEKWDAWNRLVEVDNGSTVVERYSYDGLGRRILKMAGFVSGQPTSVTHYYLAGQQVVETRDAASLSADPIDLDPHFQFVWSPRYVDSLIARDENLDSDGSCTGTGDQRLYYLSDANFNVTGVVGYNATSSVWEVKEQYAYDPYGVVTIYAPNWASQRTASAVGNTTLFAGREFSFATGLYYNRARYYDPGKQRGHSGF
jgi:RHS repeat-associated protein